MGARTLMLRKWTLVNVAIMIFTAVLIVVPAWNAHAANGWNRYRWRWTYGEQWMGLGCLRGGILQRVLHAGVLRLTQLDGGARPWLLGTG